VDATLELVGDGPQRPVFERLSTELGIGSAATFHGWLPRAALSPLYARSHLLLLPSRCSEGWPKVVSEAMAYGVVPVCSDVSSVPQYLAQAGAGMTCGAGDVAAYAAAVFTYRDEPLRWKAESERGVAFAEKFSYANYLVSVRTLLGLDCPAAGEGLVPSRDVQCPPGPGRFLRRSGVS
jgi:glycosyltransferase involved in cell wall biosynthesis